MREALGACKLWQTVPRVERAPLDRITAIRCMRDDNISQTIAAVKGSLEINWFSRLTTS